MATPTDEHALDDATDRLLAQAAAGGGGVQGLIAAARQLAAELVGPDAPAAERSATSALLLGRARARLAAPKPVAVPAPPAVVDEDEPEGPAEVVEEEPADEPEPGDLWDDEPEDDNPWRPQPAQGVVEDPWRIDDDDDVADEEPPPLPRPVVAVPKQPEPEAPALEPATTLEPAADPGDAPPPQAPGSRRILTIAALTVRDLGVVLLLFLVWQWIGTGILEHRAQSKLGHSLQKAAGPRPDRGEAFATIEIPFLGGHREVVVEGTGGAIRRGPAHASTSATPGELGNVVIFGRRSTYGSAFARLDALKASNTNTINVTYQGRLTVYAVSEIREGVKANDPLALKPTSVAQLTLVGCNPRLRCTDRIVVIARPQGRVEDVRPAGATTPKDPLGTDLGAAPAAVVWSLVVIVLIAGTGVLKRRLTGRRRLGLRIASFVLTGGAVIVLFEAVALVLPRY